MKLVGVGGFRENSNMAVAISDNGAKVREQVGTKCAPE